MAIKTYINESLVAGLICPSLSPAGVVFFCGEKRYDPTLITED